MEIEADIVDFICVPTLSNLRHWNWSRCVNFKIKSCTLRFLRFTKLKMCIMKSNIIALWRIFVRRNRDNLLTLMIFVIYVLYFVSQVVIQMSRKASYTYGFIYQSTFYMIYFPPIISIFLPNLFSTEDHLRNVDIYVAKKIPSKSRENSKIFLV